MNSVMIYGGSDHCKPLRTEPGTSGNQIFASFLAAAHSSPDLLPASLRAGWTDGVNETAADTLIVF